jgi:membrane dipeptidase
MSRISCRFPSIVRRSIPLAILVTCLAAASPLVASETDTETDTGAGTQSCVVPGLDPDLVMRARALLDQVPLIDGHNDLPWAIRQQFDRRLARVDLASDLRQIETPTHTDLPRLGQGGVGGQFWSVYIPVDFEGAEGVRAVIEQIDVVHRMVAAYPRRLALALTAEDIVRAHAAGKVGSLIGMEGGHSIGASLAVLRQLYALGARYMTLTHWRSNAWADAATSAPEHDGLSDFGREVVREMNRLGMLVDLSHVAETTMNDALEVSEAPVIFSHSSARGVVAHPRNVPDAVLRRLPENGGVVMVTFVPSFVSNAVRHHDANRDAEKARQDALLIGDPEGAETAMAAWDDAHPVPRATLAEVADHIDHIRSVAGVDHVGLGGDFDGISSVVRGLEDVTCYPALLAELARRGWSDEDLGKLAGSNLLRVMRQAEAAAKRLQALRTPSEAQLQDDDGEGS